MIKDNFITMYSNLVNVKVKIIATIGPATKRKFVIKKLIKNGMDVARINLKHASINEAVEICSILSELKCKILIDIEKIRKLESIKDLKFDYLALSFTENSKQIKNIRSFFAPKKIFVIAKIETKKGVKNINNIIEEADGIMVARGDLGKNIPLVRLPLFQKMIIKRCNKRKKFVITATEMLISMVDSKMPQRSEVSDVANAVLDGSNALMLSEETAIGKYPANAVSVMKEIIYETINSKI